MTRKLIKVFAAVFIVGVLTIIGSSASCAGGPSSTTDAPTTETAFTSTPPTNPTVTSPAETTVEGIIDSLTGDILVVTNGATQVSVELSSLTLIKRADGSAGFVGDLSPGVIVQIFYSQTTHRASNVNIKNGN